MPPVDQLDRGDERLVLVTDRAVHVVGLAPSILDLLTEWGTLEQVTAQLEKLFGSPPDGSALEAVRAALVELEAAGLLEIDTATGTEIGQDS